jgi:thiol-disulfide isomerase/thioredoxin
MKRIWSIPILLVVFFVVGGNAQSLKRQKAPNFSLSSQNGKVIELAKLKGKIVLLNFWATWCPPCRAEIPDFIDVYSTYKSKGFEIVGIALDEEGWDKVAPFMKEAKINYPIVLGSRDITQAYGGIDGIPTTFIVDRDGNIVGQQVGILTKSALIKVLKKYLKK